MKPTSPLTRRELLHARLDSLLDDCDLVADHSAYGETFDDMEVFFLTNMLVATSITGKKSPLEV